MTTMGPTTAAPTTTTPTGADATSLASTTTTVATEAPAAPPAAEQPTPAPLTSTLAPTVLTTTPTVMATAASTIATAISAGPTAAVATPTTTTGPEADGSVRVVTVDSDSSGLVIGIIVLVLVLAATLGSGGCYVHRQRRMALVNEEQLRQFNRRVTAVANPQYDATNAGTPPDGADYCVVAQTRRVAVQNQTYTAVHASSTTAQGVAEGVPTGDRVLKLERDHQVVEPANAPSRARGSSDAPTHIPNKMYQGHGTVDNGNPGPDPSDTVDVVGTAGPKSYTAKLAGRAYEVQNNGPEVGTEPHHANAMYGRDRHVVEHANAPSRARGSSDAPIHTSNNMYVGASHENPTVPGQAAAMPDPELIMTKRTHHVVCATGDERYAVPMDDSAASASAPGAATKQGPQTMGRNAQSRPSTDNTVLTLLQAHTPTAGADAADGYLDVEDYAENTVSQTSSTT